MATITVFTQACDNWYFGTVFCIWALQQMMIIIVALITLNVADATNQLKPAYTNYRGRVQLWFTQREELISILQR